MRCTTHSRLLSSSARCPIRCNLNLYWCCSPRDLHELTEYPPWLHWTVIDHLGWTGFNAYLMPYPNYCAALLCLSLGISRNTQAPLCLGVSWFPRMFDDRPLSHHLKRNFQWIGPEVNWRMPLLCPLWSILNRGRGLLEYNAIMLASVPVRGRFLLTRISGFPSVSCEPVISVYFIVRYSEAISRFQEGLVSPVSSFVL